jgi:hypothetical protein
VCFLSFFFLIISFSIVVVFWPFIFYFFFPFNTHVIVYQVVDVDTLLNGAIEILKSTLAAQNTI